MNYFEDGNKQHCNGCSLCEAMCPQNCISMQEDYLGFLYPVIDKDKCINCKKCERICSNVCVEYNSPGAAYAVVNKNKDDLKKSASGGMYLVLAKHVISQGGVVCGVRNDSKLNAVFDVAETIDDCYKFCGSKYVRAEINDIYSKIKAYLDSGRLVLFVGTSCQTNAVKILSKKYDNILLCDIICHANPSPKIYKMYLKAMENKIGSEVINIEFRTKSNGWRDQTPLLTFKNGEKIYDAIYFKAFVKELISRDSCTDCKFADIKRISDITIADLWGGNEILQNNDKYDCDEGLSLVLVNSERGARYFAEVKDNINVEPIDYVKALSYNHDHNVPTNKYKNRFLSGIESGKISEQNIYQYMEKYTRPAFVMRTRIFLGKVKRAILRRGE